MTIKKYNSMFVATVHAGNTVKVFCHQDRLIAMQMAAAFVWGEK